jgi:hypothetical protein
MSSPITLSSFANENQSDDEMRNISAKLSKLNLSDLSKYCDGK